ncbi:transposase [Flavobacterium oncorhynchi]
MKKLLIVGVIIQRMEVMTNHVHLFIKTEPADAPQLSIEQLWSIYFKNS